ncbi:MAG: YfhO family protein [Planctomycetales bacterium]|nr:YfhO family protein [Planctomycetales bacterium]
MPHHSENSRTVGSPRQLALGGLAFVVVALFFFYPLLSPDQTLVTSDDNLGELSRRASELPKAFAGAWENSYLAGHSVEHTLNWTSLGMWLLPTKFFHDWFRALDLGLASVALILFLRLRGVGWAGGALAALTAFWIGETFTTIYSGHIGKFGILMFAAWFLLLAELALRKQHSPCFVLAGGALGAMLLEQPDVGLFFALILAPYPLLAALRDRRTFSLPLLRNMGMLFLVAAALAIHPLWAGYQSAGRDAAVMQMNNRQMQWDFITQWSWPPSESLDFVTPGYYGWKTYSKENPYRGIVGQSPDWNKTGEGFANFKLTSQYLGVIPLAMMLWALIAAVVSIAPLKGRRADVFIFTGMALVSFLLACGKFLPFYHYFTMLPVVSLVRVPMKFLLITQIAIAVLAGMGLDALTNVGADYRSPGRRWLIGLVAVAIVVTAGFAAAAALLERLPASGHEPSLSQTTTPAISTVEDRRARSLVHAAVAAACLAFALAVLARIGPRRVRHLTPAAPWFLVAVMAVDAWMLSRHFVETMSFTSIRDNQVMELVKSETHAARMATVTRTDFYNLWLTIHVPYHGIESFNVLQAPRMPRDYATFLSLAAQNPIKAWQQASVRIVLDDGSLWQAIKSSPELLEQFDVLMSYEAESVDTLEPKLLPTPATEPGRHRVLRLRTAEPRYSLYRSWDVIGDAEMLDLLAGASSADPAGLYLAPNQGYLPQFGPSSPHGSGEVVLKDYSPNQTTLTVTTEAESMLRVSNAFRPGWHATVDAQPVEILRCNFLFQAVPIPPGSHQVVIEYRPPIPWSMCFQGIGLATVAGAAIALGWRRLLRRTLSDPELPPAPNL